MYGNECGAIDWRLRIVHGYLLHNGTASKAEVQRQRLTKKS